MCGALFPFVPKSHHLNSNTLEHVTNVGTAKSHNRDDITALKQTDADTNIEEHHKSNSNLLLLNKKGLIDEEIVESVSELESVITKTIENTKNIEEIPDRVVDQPEDVLLKQVLHQPTQTFDETEMSKNSEHLNLNTIYETPSEDDLSNSDNKDVAGITTITPTTLPLPRTHHTATTSNRDNHIEGSLNPSLNHLRHHNSEFKEQHAHHVAAATVTDVMPSATTTITLLPPPPPIILTDSNTLTLTTPNDNSAIVTSSTMTSSSSSPTSVTGSVAATATSTAKTTATTTSTMTSHKVNCVVLFCLVESVFELTPNIRIELRTPKIVVFVFFCNPLYLCFQSPYTFVI